MNSFADACEVEQRSLAILRPFIQDKAYQGQFVLNLKGRLAQELQRSVGDVLLNLQDSQICSLELKAEEENKHGNLFLETWSNRSRFTVGWMISLNADLLGYHFLNEDQLWLCNFQKLKRWAFHDGHIYGYREKLQGKRTQMNDTWGRCVPIADLIRGVGLRCYRATTGEELNAADEERQGSLWSEVNGSAGW